MHFVLGLASLIAILYVLYKNPLMGGPVVLSIGAIIGQDFYGKGDPYWHEVFANLIVLGIVLFFVGGIVTIIIVRKRTGRFDLNL